MNRHRSTIISLVAGLGLAFACGTANDAGLPSGSGPLSAGMGQLSVALVDAPAPAVDQIWVNVTRVTAHSTSAGWVVLSEAPFTVDLLQLQASAKQLGLVALPPGQITQIRLVVSPDGNYVVTRGQQVPLVVPSGSQSGIKIHGPWNVTECSRTAITLDFDGKKSIWTHPAKQGTEWILRPVIRARDASTTEVGCDDGGTADGGTGPADGGETPPPACTSEGFCNEGLYCVSGACVPGAGDPCTQNSGCASGVCAAGACAPGGPQTPCTLDSECLSASCTSEGCQPSGPGQPCRADSDCTTGTCTADGECGPGEAKGANSPCTISSECFSNACIEGVCQPGGQGSLCTADADCLDGLSCQNGACGYALPQ